MSMPIGSKKPIPGTTSVPTARPSVPGVKPPGAPRAAPSVRSVAPSVKPAVSKPAAPSARPAVPTARPAVPSARPAAPSVKPATTVKPAPSAAAAPSTRAVPQQGNWLNQKVQYTVAGAGGVVGGLINGVAESINGVGRGIGGGITNTAVRLGGTIKDQGNHIKDVARVGGTRAASTTNPLGLAGGVKSLPAGAVGAATGVVRRGTAGNPLGL